MVYVPPNKRKRTTKPTTNIITTPTPTVSRSPSPTPTPPTSSNRSPTPFDLDQEWTKHCKLNVRNRTSRRSGHVIKIKAQRLNFSGLDQVKVPFDVAIPALLDKFILESLNAEGMDPDSTKFCVAMHHIDFKNSKPLFLQFRTRALLDGVALFNLIGKFQQSNAALSIDDGLSLELHVYNKDNSAYADEMAGSRNSSFYLCEQLGIPGYVKNTDNLCLARAVVLALVMTDLQHAPDDETKKEIQKYAKKLKRADNTLFWRNEAISLLADCGLPTDKDTYNEKDLEEIAEYYDDYKFTVYVRPGPQRLYSVAREFNPEAVLQLNLAFFNNHYDYFKPSKVSIGRTICPHCFEPYVRVEDHRCMYKCSTCKSIGCVGESKTTFCEDCNMNFKSVECYQNHKKINPRAVMSVCDQFKVCKTCGSYYRIHNVGEQGHICFSNSWCGNCKKHVDRENHNCCWTPPSEREKKKQKEKQENFKCILYDFETVVVENPDDVYDYADEQWPNMVVFERICSKCYLLPTDHPCVTCGIKKQCIKYQSKEDDRWSVVDRFLDYLLEDPTCNNAILLAHNGSRFDSHFFVRRLLVRGIYPTLLANGLQLMQMTVNPLRKEKFNNLTFKDSYLLIPLPLATLPQAFGLPSLAKGEFPYLYNMPAHYGTKLLGLPDRMYYCLEGKSAAARANFMTWYRTAQHQPFDFDKEILLYCEMDVSILRNSITKYIKTCVDLTGWNPIVHCCTYAGFSMHQLKMDHMKPGQVGIIPENGVFNNEHQSDLALKYIQWLEKENGVELQYKLRGGEFKIAHQGHNFRVDAIDHSSNTVYEVLGCFYHGCEKHAGRDEVHPYNGKTMAQILAETEARIKIIESHGYTVIKIWECEIKLQLKRDREMANFFKSCVHKSRLRPREAFMGGRTQTYRLLAEADSHKSIQYLDFCSLYPYTTAYLAEYPIGYPEVITSDFKPFVTGQDSPYKGLVMCDILAPPDIQFPIIGVRLNNKLVYCTCRTCAENADNTPCTHYSEKERFLHVSVCHVELSHALRNGYKVLRCYEVWSWNTWEMGGLFKEFTKKFIKLKQEASGWPSSDMTEEQKVRFLEDHKENVGVELDRGNIAKNGPLRTVAKLLLNSVWGKTGQNPDKTVTEFMPSNSEKLCKLINNTKIEITGFSLLDDSVVCSYKPRVEYRKPVEYTNVAIAAYTTAYARLRLLEAMSRVGDDLLYVDTDSLIFLNDDSKPDRLADLRADRLGFLTSEIPEGYRITKFVSMAPKVYSYLLENDAGDVKTVCKVKGVTLDSEAAKKINFQVMEEMVRDLVAEENPGVVETERAMIVKKLGQITTKVLKKRLQPVMTKLRYLTDFTTVPYGYLDQEAIDKSPPTTTATPVRSETSTPTPDIH